ncbi:BTAD domain-containing putative transcriptional regulator [Angustibacter peucedani]
MQFRLLGPFDVLVDGTTCQVAGRGERALLALLALSPGQVLAASTLIDRLWDPDSLPTDPGNALQLRVSKLRRALAAYGVPDLVRREGAGYLLDVAAEDVDAHQFTRLIATARRTGEPQQALDAYDEALALWRGDPLVDFAGEQWSTVEAARLDELRLAAVAERAERMLTLGRYEHVVADLEPVVALAPTRERLVGQLMTALFNAGRQAEALAVYGRTRTMLAEELGIDPSRELRAVMEAILRQEESAKRPTGLGAAGLTSRTERPATHPGVPRQQSTPASADSGAASQAEATPARDLGNLPLRSTTFVGRESDLGRVADLLADSRLVTLAGPGGAGKTALAVEAARAVAGRFRDGVTLVRLAAVTERDTLPHAVADALGVTIEGGTAAHRPRDLLVAQLRDARVLLVLDNCEHLIEPIAALAETLLARCPDVHLLATSREALAVPGEVQVPVAPLPVPVPGAAAADVAAVAAARLFLDRARVASPLLAATLDDAPADEETMAAVAAICRRLDGIPLALELAAARLASLSPSELAERVVDRFAVLTSGPRTADARQQTLRATVDWSHDLLTAPEQALFRRLAVFRGGWTLDAAEHVVTNDLLADLAGEPPGERSEASLTEVDGDVLDLLDRLVRQSLVVVDRPARPGARTRYRMLETLRQYAADKLAVSGEETALAGAHARYFLTLGERAETGLRGHGHDHWLAALTDEHANIRAALAWFIDTDGQAEGALRLAGSLGLYWHKNRHLEGRETLRRVMALPGGSPAARARAMQAVSLVERPRACIVHPSEQCAAAAAHSLRIFEQVGDRPRAAFSRLLLAVEGVGANPRPDAEALLEQADRDFAALDDDWGRAVAAFVQMETLTKRGDEPGAEAAATTALTRFRALQDGWGLSAVLYHRAWGLARFGHHADAVPVYEEAIEVAAHSGVMNTVQWATADLGMTLLALGRVQDATACFARAGSISDQVGDDAGRVLGTYGTAVLAHDDGAYATARPLFAAAGEALERLGVPLAAGLALAGVASCDEHLGDAVRAAGEYQRLVALGERAGEVGLVAAGLEGLARAALVPGDVAGAREAARLLGRAGCLRDTYDRPPTSAELAAATSARTAATTVLGPSAYDDAARDGAALGLRVGADG